MFELNLKVYKESDVKEHVKSIYFNLLKQNSSKKAKNLMLIGLNKIINKSKNYKFDNKLDFLANKDSVNGEKHRNTLRDICNQIEQGEFVLSLPSKKVMKSKKRHSHSKRKLMDTISEENENEEDLEEVKGIQEIEESKQPIQEPPKPLTSMEGHVPRRPSEEKKQPISFPQESYCITLFKWICCCSCSPCSDRSDENRDNRDKGPIP